MGRDEKTWSVALTYRPKGGVHFTHEGWLRAFLVKYAAQWECFEETIDDDDSTRHIHGRILLKANTRMDRVKVNLVRHLNAELSEKRVLLKGIRFLYDDWEYMRKEGNPIPDLTHLADENDWIYADPANKTAAKPKNHRLLHQISLIRDKLPASHIDPELVAGLFRPLIAAGELEMPGTQAAWKNLLWAVSFHWNSTIDFPPAPTEPLLPIEHPGQYEAGLDPDDGECLMDSECDSADSHFF